MFLMLLWVYIQHRAGWKLAWPRWESNQHKKIYICHIAKQLALGNRTLWLSRQGAASESQGWRWYSMYRFSLKISICNFCPYSEGSYKTWKSLNVLQTALFLLCARNPKFCETFCAEWYKIFAPRASVIHTP
jgi:hypothetical protein